MSGVSYTSFIVCLVHANLPFLSVHMLLMCFYFLFDFHDEMSLPVLPVVMCVSLALNLFNQQNALDWALCRTFLGTTKGGTNRTGTYFMLEGFFFTSCCSFPSKEAVVSS